jgi:c-di-GMP-binding flagellar brake protein YcgR
LTPPTVNPGNDRRNYFRIDDHVVMSYRPVPTEELPEALQALGQTLKDSGTLTTTFADISQRTVFLKKQIRQESPALADYLDILEDKLGMLARALLLRDMGVNEEATLVVNLSAGGIEFHTDEPLAPGTTLEMQFIVFPSRHGILTGGKVIRCEPDADSNPAHYKVAVEFAFIRETDRQLIMKHVLGRQSSQLRKQRSAGKDGQEEN